MTITKKYCDKCKKEVRWLYNIPLFRIENLTIAKNREKLELCETCAKCFVFFTNNFNECDTEWEVRRLNNNDWIKCSEKLPKQESIDGRMVSDCVLVYTSDGDMRKAIYCDNEWLYFAFGLFVLPFSEDVIYWRLLPEPPKEEN